MWKILNQWNVNKCTTLTHHLICILIQYKSNSDNLFCKIIRTECQTGKEQKVKRSFMHQHETSL